MIKWNSIDKSIPPPGKVVMVWFENWSLPGVAYLKRYTRQFGPDYVFFVTYGMRHDAGHGRVTHWADCCPENGPEGISEFYERNQREHNKRIRKKVVFNE